MDESRSGELATSIYGHIAEKPVWVVEPKVSPFRTKIDSEVANPIAHVQVKVR